MTLAHFILLWLILILIWQIALKASDTEMKLQKLAVMFPWKIIKNPEIYGSHKTSLVIPIFANNYAKIYVVQKCAKIKLYGHYGGVIS